MRPNGTSPAARIGLDVRRERNRALLTELFVDSEVVGLSESVPEETALCVVDAAALERDAERFDAWRTRQAPVFAPVVLLSETERTDPWAALTEADTARVDAILQLPVSKAELSARVDNLLEMREISRALDEEQQLTRLVFESSPLAKVVADTDGTVVRANERAGELFGVAPETLVGRPHDDGEWTAVADDGTEIPSADLPLTQVLASGQPVYGQEYAIRRSADEDLWVSANAAPIRDETGAVTYVVVIMEDITVRRAQAATLERQVDLFQKAQRIADVGAWEYDLGTEELYWTEEVSRIYGYPLDVTPTPALAVDRFVPGDREPVRTALENAIDRGESVDVVGQIDHPDGDRRWVRVRGEPQQEGDTVVRIRGTMQDITDRRERETELLQMQNAVDKAPIGIVLSDPTQADNPLVYVNDGFIEQTGYGRDEAVGRNCRFLQGPDTDEETVATLRRAVAAEASVSVTIRNYRADGSLFWNRLRIAPVRADDGTVVNFIGFQRDVTDLVERRRQLGTLDRYLRHNVRNKMSVVQGLAEMIEQEGRPSVADYADRIEQTSETLLGNMQKERAITKVLQADADTTPTELLSLLRPVVTDFAQQYPEATVTLRGPGSVHTAAIPGLAAAFEELVRNAIEHNDTDAPTAEVTVDPGDDVVRVTVADDGPGIPEMEVDVLGDWDAETTVNHGQGLGLWLVELTVRRSGGRLEFTERPEGGTAVTVELPTADADGAS